MTHQLIPNTYCILTPKDCKKWFEWAKENGVKTMSAYNDNENYMLFEDDCVFTLEYEDIDFSYVKGIPASEFLSRLQGTWESDEVIVKLNKEQHKVLTKALRHVSACNTLINKEVGVLETIKEQLNQQP